MTLILVLHLTNEDPIVVDVDEMPDPTHAYLVGHNPRRRDNKDIHYIDADVVDSPFPMASSDLRRTITFWRRQGCLDTIPRVGAEFMPPAKREESVPGQRVLVVDDEPPHDWFHPYESGA